MDKLGKIIESITKPRHEEDFTDRLNYSVTVYILLAAAFTIIAKEYGGDPIQCWLPAELASQRGWEQYAEDYCFVENTYYVPLDQNLPQSSRHRAEKELKYYQWVPFLLILQALMFTMPHIFWRMLNWMSGIQTRAIITMASKTDQINPIGEEVSEVVDVIANHIQNSLKAKKIFHQFLHSNPLVVITRTIWVSYLCWMYMITKALFIGNALFQFSLLSHFLGASGYELTKALFYQQSWIKTGYFPRVTMCDFKVRSIGNRQRHTIQCVLMANMFNEKIYIALWWWILILITLTCLNFLYWMYILLNSSSKYDFIYGIVRLGNPKEKMTKYKLDGFVRYIGKDGLLVIRLMTQNAGEIITGLITARLFDLYCANEYKENDNYIPRNIFSKMQPVPIYNDEKSKDISFSNPL